jgi:hypothetical protein
MIKIETMMNRNEDVSSAVTRVQGRALKWIKENGGEWTEDAKMGAVRQDGSAVWIEIITPADKARTERRQKIAAAMPAEYLNEGRPAVKRGWMKQWARACAATGLSEPVYEGDNVEMTVRVK